MLVPMIVCYFGRRILTSRHVLVVLFQGGKQIRHPLQVIMPHPIRERRKLQRSYGGSPLKPRLQ